MTPEELERRRPVWDVMSDVFLDIETRWGMPRIAFVLARSGYSAEELDAIWEHEIVPECAWNLLQVAGEWALFVVDEDRLTERAAGKRSLLDRMMGVASPIVIGGHWRAITSMREALVALSPDEGEQATRAAMWTAFVHAYIEGPPDQQQPGLTAVHAKALANTGTTEAELLAAFEDVRPVFRSLLSRAERGDDARNANAVRELIARACSLRGDGPR
jgi:hypothetical protein